MPVTPENIAVALGVTAPDPESVTWKQWELWISDAYMLIEARVEELGASEPDQARKDYVVRESVVSHARKPDDSTQVTIQVDDGMSTKSYKSSRGRVSLDDWWGFLGLGDDSKAFSIDTLGPRSAHLPWCSLVFKAEFCSCGVDIAGRPIFEDAPL